MANERIDRKALTREYKQTARPAGVFAVRNLTDAVMLVGSSSDLPSMLNRQRFQLDGGLHPDKKLLADWQRLGAAAFSFEVLDRLEDSDNPARDLRGDLETLLEMWIAKLEAEGAALYPTTKRQMQDR